MREPRENTLSREAIRGQVLLLRFFHLLLSEQLTVSLTDTTGCFYLHKIPPEKLLIKIIEYPLEKSICIDFTDEKEKENR